MSFQPEFPYPDSISLPPFLQQLQLPVIWLVPIGRGSIAAHTPVQYGPGSRGGTVLYISHAASDALQAIMPTDEVTGPEAPVFGLSTRQIGRGVYDAAKAVGRGEGFTRDSDRGGMAQTWQSLV